MTDDDEVRRRRAVYRASHRGTKEMDWLLGRYAEAELPRMTTEQLSAFEELLALPDPALQDMILSGNVPADAGLAHLIGAIRALHGLT